MRVGLSALLRKQIQVDSLVLKQPAIELVRNREGRWNFSSLGGESTSEKGSGAFALGRMQIEDGSIAVTDLANRSPRLGASTSISDLRDFGPGKVFAHRRCPPARLGERRAEGRGQRWATGKWASRFWRVRMYRTSLAVLMFFMNGQESTATRRCSFPHRRDRLDRSSDEGPRTGMMVLAGLNAALGYPVRIDYLRWIPNLGFQGAPTQFEGRECAILLLAELDTKSSFTRGWKLPGRASPRRLRLHRTSALPIRTLGSCVARCIY